ncbi:MAG: DNA repair and recombination protein RadB [Candidatus Aenigmarchaeota archaeon]|nr:DNA repair and recombination protein RadB [Candidatus Aenigmarchaeota archaeon]
MIRGRLSIHPVIDELLNGGAENGAITNIYGDAGSGKTNIALLSALKCLRLGKKIIYMDTESSFSFERFCQVGGNHDDLKNILFIEPESWNEQCRYLEDISKKEMSGIGLIIIDSIAALYRLEITQENYTKINRQLATQYSILSNIARKHNIPVIVTSQVYTNIEDGNTEITSKNIARFWSRTLVEIIHINNENRRAAIVRKHRSIPENRRVEFLITQDGLGE